MDEISISIEEEEKMTEEEEKVEVDNIHFYKTKDEFDIQGNIYGNRIYKKVTYR